MSDQKYAGGRGGLADAVRLTARAGLNILLGGFALLTIVTVASALGPMLALDLYTPPVAAWWTAFTAVVVQGVPFLLRVRAGGRQSHAARGGTEGRPRLPVVRARGQPRGGLDSV